MAILKHRRSSYDKKISTKKNDDEISPYDEK